MTIHRINDTHLDEHKRMRYNSLKQLAVRTEDAMIKANRDLMGGVDWTLVPEETTQGLRADIGQIELSRMVLMLQTGSIDAVVRTYEAFTRNMIINNHCIEKGSDEAKMMDKEMLYMDYFVHLFMVINGVGLPKPHRVQSLTEH